ncbi:MAG TPA: sigma-70 family RNA polymerase sigma factor [Candidatus Methylacidiphilales bacterium]|nr:sigma-70 family RNA polymerase sigma factor [Candidatus Methylacidiphilales bacterium]
MPGVSDMELVRDYGRQGSEEAFAELVRRHIHLVYSAALRHTGNTAHAEEITQAVFVILARKAGSLRPNMILAAWLYETTRWTSLSFLRGERRRHMREQEAYMRSTFEKSDDPSLWNQLAPLLDEAMGRLGPKDREAVVLRFFKEKNLREIAEAMNVTEPAAQSRVHRAVEKLRRFFLKHGIDSTASAISGAISAHSVQTAPVALVKTVTTVALTKGATASTATSNLIKGTLKIMVWTKAKTAIAGAIIAGLAVYSVIQYQTQGGLREENQKLRQQQASLQEQLQKLQKEHTDTASELSSLQAENAQLQSQSNQTARAQEESDPSEMAAKAWMARVNQLKQYIQQTPGANIPELRLVTDNGWLTAAANNLETGDDYRRAAALVRQEAETTYAADLMAALQAYSKANGGQFPADLSRLDPYFKSSADAGMLQDWTIVPGANGTTGADSAITQKAPVDEQYDTRLSIGINSLMAHPWAQGGTLIMPAMPGPMPLQQAGVTTSVIVSPVIDSAPAQSPQ